MNYTKNGEQAQCRDCGQQFDEVDVVWRKFADRVEFLCRNCERAYPKTDDREWRPAEFTDGEPVRTDRGIVVLDTDEVNVLISNERIWAE